MNKQITGQMLGDYLRHQYEQSDAKSIDEFSKGLTLKKTFCNNIMATRSVKPHKRTIDMVCEAFGCSREDIVNFNINSNDLLGKESKNKGSSRKRNLEMKRYSYLRDPIEVSKKIKEIMDNRGLNVTEIATLLRVPESYAKNVIDGVIDKVSDTFFVRVLEEVKNDEVQNEKSLKQRLKDVVNVVGAFKVADALNVPESKIEAYLNDDPVRSPENIGQRLKDYFANADRKSIDKPLIPRPKYAEPFAAAKKLAARADMTASFVARRRKTPSPRR